MFGPFFTVVLIIGALSTSSSCAVEHQVVERVTEPPHVRVIEDPMAAITDDHPCRWVVQWTAPKRYAGPLDLEIRRVHYNMRWESIESADGKARLIRSITQGGGRPRGKTKRSDTTLATFRIGTDVEAGDTYQFAITATGLSVSGVTTVLQLVVKDDSREVVQGVVRLTMHPGPGRELQIIARPSLQKDGRARVVLVPVDELGYPASFARPLPVTVWVDETQLWEGRVQDAKRVLLSIPANGVVRLTARVERTDATEVVLSNPIWPTGHRGQVAAFGDLHWHTELSGDATRGIVEALTAARDYMNLDFASPSDHAPSGKKWIESVRACDRFNEIDNFAVLYAWERSSAKGHVNFYFTNPDHPMNPDKFKYPKEPKQYIENIPHKGFVAIPHHTNSRGKVRNGKHAFSAYPWGKPRDSYLRLIEIMQTRGNYERENAPAGWAIDGRNNGASAQVALAKGHKLGFIASTDNHKGWPSVGRSVRADGQSGRIYAGMWAKRRSRQGIYDALYDRHTWACWDTRAIVLFEIDSAMQGDELELREPRRLTARIKMSVEAPLDVLDVVTEDGRAVSVDVSDELLDIETQLDLGRVEESTFFYLRARQRDGALIYASPIFVTVH